MRKGFTLIELLIVIAVIAALMAVATPVAINAIQNAKASQVAQNLANIKTAFENYFYAEHPDLSDTTTVPLDTLQNYLNPLPDSNKYSISVNEASPNVYDVTITYTGGDVSVDKVKNNLSVVEKDSNNNPFYKFQVRQWW